MSAEYFLQSIQITRVKNLVDVEIRLDRERHLTALMGPNGFGKSTILHLLAASFGSVRARQDDIQYDAGESHRYTEFFPATPLGSWAGTSVQINNVVKRGENIATQSTNILKNEGQAWQPLQGNKILRETYFIGVASALPEIEAIRDSDDVNFGTVELADEISDKLKSKLGYIFNRDYTQILDHQISDNKRIIGVTYRGISYSSLSMGAGEQRVFKILHKVISCQKNALVLIDEIDLLLHTDALERLLTVLSQMARKKDIQIIFTTHKESIIDFNAAIAIRHIYNAVIPHLKTYCFNETKPGAIQRLTGKATQPLLICCEDEVAAAIIKRVAQESGLGQYTKIQMYGAWTNCFTLVSALTLENKDMDNSLFILDGDITDCKSDEQKDAVLGKLITGTSANARELRRKALSKIIQFTPPNNESPERVLYDMLRTVDAPEERSDIEMIDVFKNLNVVEDSHKFVDYPLSVLGETKEAGLTRIMGIASKTDFWEPYTRVIRQWFDSKRQSILEL